MSNQLIDAVRTAKAIHEGDYSSLRGKSFVIRDNIEKKKDHHGGKTVKKPTLSQRFDTLSQRLDELTEIVKDGFKRVNTRIDNLEKDVNARIDRIEQRLDYNGLKDLPKGK